MLQRLRIPPRPPMPTRLRTQLEAFFVLRRNPLELWGELAYREEALDGRFLGRKQIMLNAPDAIRHVLVTNADNYRRNRATKRVLSPILGQGLFLAEGEAWRHQRRTIAPALAPRMMGLLARHVVAASQALERELDSKLHRPLQMLPLVQRLALNIAGQSMFSLEMSDFGTELRTLITEYGLRYARPGPFDLILPEGMTSPSDLGRGRFRHKWLAFLDRVIAQRTALPRAEGAPRDLFDLLCDARDPETDASFTPEQLRDEVSTMILAGHETTAVTLFWCLYLAALYPDLQHEVAEEARASALDGSELNLPHARAHVDEALRLYPPAFLIVREAVAADRIGDRNIEPGTVVTISPWVLHRHRARWRDPDMFDPSRFLPGAPAPERFAYMPFGAGPRICVGASFALTEAVLVLARLLGRYAVRLCGSGAVMPRGIVTTQPDRPVWFELAARRL